MPEKFIAHIDLDCFFVSVERIKYPSLNNKPVVVGGSGTGRGVVASASYQARKFGVRSAMPTAQALRLCPQLIVVSGHHSDYSDYSNRLYKRMLEVALIVERASIDEMYLDFTGCESLYDNDLPAFMKKLQSLIKSEFNLPCTIGLASNKLIAKISANTVKPEGVIYIPHGDEEKFLAPLPIGVISGVGKKTEEFLIKKGYKIVADLQAAPIKKMIELLGAHGEWIFNASHGRGSTTLETEHIIKSISREETFEKDISDTKELENILFTLVEDVCSTLRSKSFKAKIITLKYRTSKFETFTRRKSINPTDYDPDVFNVAKDLLKSIHNSRTPVRLVGIGVSNFVDSSQIELELFPSSDRREKVMKAIDNLRDKFGVDSIKIGGGV